MQTDTILNMNTDKIPFLSFQQNRILSEHLADMSLWNLEIPRELLPESFENCTKNEVQKFYRGFISWIEEYRKKPIDYSDFNPVLTQNRKPEIISDFTAPSKIMGRCPCPSEDPILRCCNLKTLDAVQQCGYACAYCSIQSFYSQNQIRVVSDLNKVLSEIKLNEETWHIGTGQSSDSLLLGDDYGTLTALGKFAAENPDVVIELKTKSSRTDWLKLNLPVNIISTWSVNANTVSQKEEHLASSVRARIQAAEKAGKSDRLVGFHIHPMVYFTDWKKEYRDTVNMICDSINPDNAVMIGMGALTFTKQNLRTLRESKRPTRVTQMPLNPIAGKYSYSNEIKEEMFSYVFECFPEEWKKKVFFYLCMEDKALWEPCLKRSYESNYEFENDMKSCYLKKISEKVHS